MKLYFGTLIGREAGDAYKNLVGDEAAFRDGFARLKASYIVAQAVVVEVFGEKS